MLKQCTSFLLLGTALFAVGCQSAQDEHVSYVLLDQSARQSGFAVEVSGARSDAILPVEVEQDDEVLLVGPTGKTLLDPRADILFHVRGPEGKIDEVSIADSEIDTLVIDGQLDAVKELSHTLAGEHKQMGRYHTINAPFILGESSRVRAPMGIVEVFPPVGESLIDKYSRLEAAVANGDGAEGRAVKRSPEEMPISAHDLLPLSVACADPIVGTWMSHAYYPRMNEWYIFTIHVERSPGSDTALIGEIRSEFWHGSPSDRKPPSCDDEAVHGAVRMQAMGAAKNGQLDLQGTSWQPEHLSCGQHRWSMGYNLDRFSGSYNESSITGLNNDGGRAIDEPIELRRVSCK